MMRTPYSEKELDIIGHYIPRNEAELVSPVPKRNTPVTQKENFRLRFEGKTPWWIPQSFDDITLLRPRINADVVACQLISDGGPRMHYDSMVNPGLFGIMWEYVPVAMGATVHPGKPMIEDIDRWEDLIHFPNLDELDWEGQAEMSRAYLNQDRLNVGCMLCGLWERLISLMDVEGAAIALVDEEQQDGVHSLLSAMCDFYDDYIGRLKKYFDIEAFYVHDDWGTQNAPFFSVDTFREMILPYLKRLVNSCHSRGIYYIQHSCGNVEALVPCMIEAGVDMWDGQDINDLDMLAETYKDAPIIFMAASPQIPENASENDLDEIAKTFVEKHKDHRIVLNAVNQRIKKLYPYIYKHSRLLYANAEE